jgi:cell division septation protein DedD
MRNNETGEFELIVGNRQLLSGFFIVVLLFAVAFAMGYVVGQNSPRSAKALAESVAPSPSTPMDNSRPPAAGKAAPPRVDPSPAAEAPQEPDAQPQPSTQPAREPDVAPTVSKASAEPPAAAPGSYWQVIAAAQPDAEVIYKTLKDKGFPAYMSPGPNNLVRVVVGPYNDTQTMGRAKTELENAGFRPFRK